jgi:hypothetical protein
MTPAFKNLITAFGLATESGSLFSKVLMGIGRAAAIVTNSIAQVTNILSYFTTKISQNLSQQSAEGFKQLAIDAKRKGNQADFLKYLKMAQEAQHEAVVQANRQVGIAENLQATNDTLINQFGLANDEQKKRLKLLDEEQKKLVAQQETKEIATTKEATKLAEEYAQKKANLDEFYNYQLTWEEFMDQRKLELKNKEGSYYNALLREKMGMNSMMYQSMQIMAETSNQYIASKNKALFKFGQALGIGNVAIHTSEAIMKVWSQLGFPYAIPVSLIVAGAGIMEASKIAKQKVPSYDVGAWNVPQDTLAMVHKSEMILPAGVASEVRQGNTMNNTSGDTYHFHIAGSVVAEKEILNLVDKGRGDRAQRSGRKNYAQRLVY